MPSKLQTSWQMTVLISLLLAAVLLGGCSARAGSGETASQATSPEPGDDPPLLLDLPALVITYDPDGTPGVGANHPLSELQSFLPETLIRQLTLDAAFIQRLTDAGIQHMMISNTPAGLRVLVNGQPLPTVAWNQQSLDNALALLDPADDSVPGGMRNLAAVVTNLGVGLVVQLPHADGATPAIPLIVEGDESNAERAQASRRAFLEHAGGTPVIQIPVDYAEDGTWSVLGISDTEWQALTGLPFGYIRLNPQLVAEMSKTGISKAIIWTDREGVHLRIGDRELPYLRWADGGIETMVGLLLQLGVIQGPAVEQKVLDLAIQEWLPALQVADLRVVVHFPAD